MEVKAEYLAIFSEEAGDQLREWEESLLALEKSPEDREPLNNLFRAIHTLKGSAGFIGFDLLQKLAHDLESSLSSVRDGERPYDGALSDLLFKGLDLARSLIETFSCRQRRPPGMPARWTSSWRGWRRRRAPETGRRGSLPSRRPRKSRSPPRQPSSRRRRNLPWPPRPPRQPSPRKQPSSRRQRRRLRKRLPALRERAGSRFASRDRIAKPTCDRAS